MYGVNCDSRISISGKTTDEFRRESARFSPTSGAFSSVTNAADRCFDWMASISKGMGDFLMHRYADFHLFFRSYCSLIDGTTQRDIHFRISQVTQLIAEIEHCNDQSVVRERFQSLCPPVRALFFYVDQNYIDTFVIDTLIGDLSQAQKKKEEIIRECNQIIRFQHQLLMVNAIYRMICGRGGTTRIYASGGRGRSPGFEPITVITDRVPVTSREINLNVPGTIPYVQDAIPEDVQEKAGIINALKEEFAGLENHPLVPAIYNDVIMEEGCMEMPIFDASHPAVQEALTAAAAPGATSEAIAAVNDRDRRHLFDKEVLEECLRIRPGAKCPLCRHPEIGAIDREFLRIDTDLQDQILEFLTQAVNAAVPRSQG